MSKRNKKYKVDVSKGRYTPEGFENAYRFNWSNYSDEVYKRPISAKYMSDVINGNMWAYNACKINARSSVGLGFDESTDKDIIDNIYIKEMRNAVMNLQYFYEMFFEVKVRQRKALPVLYSIPSTTVLKGRKGKYTNKYVINFKSDNEQLYDAFDPIEYQLGKLPDGDYIYHIKEGYGNYGEIPTAALKRLEIQNGFETSVNSWYKNDAVPDIIIAMFGIDPESDQAKEIKNMINRNFQGAEKRGKATMLFSPLTKGESDPSVIPVTKNIVDIASLKFDETTKFDISAFYGTPSWMLNLATAGKLSTTQDKMDDIVWYKASKISDIHSTFEDEVWSVLYPEKNIVFNELNIEYMIPNANMEQEINETIDKMIKNEIIKEG